MKPHNSLPRSVGILSSLLLGLLVLGCGSGIPEFRPGYFDDPLEVKGHGRIVEKQYRSSSGFGTEGSTDYIILEVNRRPVRIPDGYIKQTEYCDVWPINAVALEVRGTGESAGIYIFQLDGDKQILEKLCEYSDGLGSWDGPRFKQCETEWDAGERKRVPSCGVPKNTYLIPASMKPQWINIEYDNPKCPPVSGNECDRELIIPESGFLCTSSNEQKRSFTREYFLVDDDGKRTPVDARENIRQAGTLSKNEPAPETGTGICKVSLSQFFFGSRTDLRASNTIFENKDFLNYHPQCKY